MKNMKKQLATKKERFEVLLEEIRSEVHVVHEQTSDLMQLKPKVDQLIEDVAIIKTDIEIMKGLLKRKVDTEEFEALESRVRRLENRAIA